MLRHDLQLLMDVESSSEICPSPGSGGCAGRAPVLMMMVDAIRVRVVPSDACTSTRRSPTNRASPNRTSTPASARRRSLPFLKSDTIARLRATTEDRSTDTSPQRTPKSEARFAKYATRALAIIVFDGVHPSLMQVPPM